ncbi:MAG: phosphoribosylglycinamide formyltransferase [Limnobacter sp.]|nr:phosphoribosylglycinamide formyltransferase [Limnobacter sp.]
MQKSVPSIVVLISGRGSNLSAILAHSQTFGDYRVSAVLSNRPDAAGLDFAQMHGIPTAVVDHKQFSDRDAFDAALAAQIDTFDADLVVLAGFMRILTPGFVSHFEGRLVNIHPSLLPAFPGLNTHQQALDAGVRLHGATVHLVTAQLDHGPILDQAIVQVQPNDTATSLADRLLKLEHRMYPRAIAAFANGRIRVENGIVVGSLEAPLIFEMEKS